MGETLSGRGREVELEKKVEGVKVEWSGGARPSGIKGSCNRLERRWLDGKEKRGSGRKVKE